MSIKERRKRASTDSQNQQHPGRRVVPEAEIRDFIGGLDLQDISDAAFRFQIVADITSHSSQRHVDRLDASAFRLLEQLSRQSNNMHYRRIMKAIIAAAAQGAQGINNAHLTATQVVEFAFRWTGEYVAALRSYRDTLRSMRQLPTANTRSIEASLAAIEDPASAMP